MNDYYLYLPCPGSSGIQFYSNVNPNNYVGPIIRFNTNTGASKIQLGNCFSVSIVSAEFPPPGLVNIDWNAVTYSIFNICTECEELVECTGCPPGYTFDGTDCVATELIPATYSGGTLTLEPGARTSIYGLFGLRLYPDITAVVPVVGNGAAYNVVGTAGNVIPIINSLKNALWGGAGIGVCDTGCTGGRLNDVGLWGPGAVYDANGCTNPGIQMYPQGNWIEIDYCFNSGPVTKQFLIGVAGDNKIKITLDSVDIITLDATNNGWNGPYQYWHVFPITISAGNHTLKVSGYNLADVANFGAEIYDITLGAFQASLTTPAVGTDCGNLPSDIDPYIIFSTRDFVGQVIADPDNPGVWSCPVGTIDYCNGGPQCLTEVTIAPENCAYILTSCCNSNLTYIADISGFTTPGVYYYTGIDNVGIPYGCYDIQEYTGASVISTAISLDSLLATACGNYPCDIFCLDCNCYRVRFKPANIPGGSGSTTISYYTCNDSGAAPLPVGGTYEVPNDGSWGEKVCARDFVFLTNVYEMQSVGACDSDANPISPTYTCPNYYTLVSCKNPAVTICVNNDLSQYLGSIVVINGNPNNCYYVQESTEPCLEPVNVTIVESFATCEECQQETFYQLSNCDNPSIIIYTPTDFSANVGQIITVSEYPDDCWSVTEVTSALDPIALTLVNSFATCEECQQVYYLLEDCLSENPNIITGTDLSAYVGQVITLPYCPDVCWEVSVADTSVGAEAVSVGSTFIDCDECLANLLCLCSTVTNTSNTAITYEYYDCGLKSQVIRVEGQATSPKLCVRKWVTTDNAIFNYYGECVDDKCPVILPPKRTVTPGYNTPGCSIEKYEKYMCNFSEGIYMQVMVDKYGIEPCCGDDSYKWEIKKELIELKAIEDPDYVCMYLDPCGCTTGLGALTSCIPPTQV
jgi:hypothetical protein